jgi:hypothetical protein
VVHGFGPPPDLNRFVGLWLRGDCCVWLTVCVCDFVWLHPPRAALHVAVEVPAISSVKGTFFFAELAQKLALNAVSTGSQVMKVGGCWASGMHAASSFVQYTCVYATFFPEHAA